MRHLELASGHLAGRGQGADDEMLQGLGLLRRVGNLDQLLGLFLAGTIAAKSRDGRPVGGGGENSVDALSWMAFRLVFGADSGLHLGLIGFFAYLKGLHEAGLIVDIGRDNLDALGFVSEKAKGWTAGRKVTCLGSQRLGCVVVGVAGESANLPRSGLQQLVDDGAALGSSSSNNGNGRHIGCVC